jgi:hypothetical protein
LNGDRTVKTAPSPGKIPISCKRKVLVIALCFIFSRRGAGALRFLRQTV